MTGKGKIVRTVVRDCLYLNWAFPISALPTLPEPLRYEEHAAAGQRLAFGSALLFRHEHIHLAGLPFLRLSYPQFHFRFYVRDHEGVPSVYFHRVLVPGWVVPSARWVAHQPALSGRFAYPRPSVDLDRQEWNWEVSREGSLKLSARQASPRVGDGPSLGTWNRTVDYFRLRRRGYVVGRGGLRSIKTTQHSVALWPIEASFEKLELLVFGLGLQDGSRWPNLHSGWLCPEIPYVFELSADTISHALRRSAAPVAADPALFGPPTHGSNRSAA